MQHENIHPSGDKAGSPFEIMKTPLANPDMNHRQCFTQSVRVEVNVDGTWYPTISDLDPQNCFNSDAEIKIEESENNAILANLTNGMAYNEKLFHNCLHSINILNHDKKAIPFEKVAGFHWLVKITALNRLKNHTLTVEYRFRGNITRTKELFVPNSSKEKDNINIVIVTAAGSGILFILLSVAFSVCVYKRKARDSRGEAWSTDENHTYGTYARGWDGEGDYGDGDVTEAVDNNDLYGAMGTSEIHDSNDLYES